MTMPSEHLAEFYHTYAEWLDEGAPQGKPLTRDYGLCANLIRFCVIHGYAYENVSDELDNQFKAAGLSRSFPFNEYPRQYSEEADRYAAYLNPKRIQWVREHCNVG